MNPSEIRSYILSHPLNVEDYARMIDAYFFGNVINENGGLVMIEHAKLVKPLRIKDGVIEYNPKKFDHENIFEILEPVLLDILIKVYKPNLMIKTKQKECLRTAIFEDDGEIESNEYLEEIDIPSEVVNKIKELTDIKQVKKKL